MLTPRMIWQGLRTRRHAPQLAEPAGARCETIGNGPPLSLLIVGDSSAAGVGVDHQRDALAGQIALHLSQTFTLQWTLRARNGATTRSSLLALRADPPARADVALVVLGVNDITRMVPQHRWLARQQALCADLMTHAQPRHIYLTALPPMEIYPLLPDPLRQMLGQRAAAFDAARRAYLPDGEVIRHVPLPGPFDTALMASDGYHPGAQAYAMWGKQLAQRIAADWPVI